jgi:Chalcone isomerase-like
MRRVPVFVLFGLITISGLGVAHGKECAGVSVPDQVQVEDSTLVLNGAGLRQATMLKVNVYVAALYTAKATSDPDAILGSSTPKQLVLQFVRTVGAADLNKAWEEGFTANAKPQLPARATISRARSCPSGWVHIPRMPVSRPGCSAALAHEGRRLPIPSRSLRARPRRLRRSGPSDPCRSQGRPR